LVALLSEVLQSITACGLPLHPLPQAHINIPATLKSVSVRKHLTVFCLSKIKSIFFAPLVQKNYY